MRQSPKLWQRTRIGPSGRSALELLACCPRMPTDVLGVLLGHRQPVTTAQLLARLRGLVAELPPGDDDRELLDGTLRELELSILEQWSRHAGPMPQEGGDSRDRSVA